MMSLLWGWKMSEPGVLPELKQILGSLIFGANRPLPIREMRACLKDVAERYDDETKVFQKVSEKKVIEALEELETDLKISKAGFILTQVAGGYRLQSDANCGKWLKSLLDKGKPERLSRPGLETLAIIAYRQPIAKSEVEGIRGVDVGHMIKALMEMQLVRIVGRSELPGRPFLYGTTISFLDHFGLRDLASLKDMEPMLALSMSKQKDAEDKEKVSVADEPLVESDEEVAEDVKDESSGTQAGN
jgi:segregation and condensation protein B